MILKGGHATTSPRLDAIPFEDARNAGYPSAPLISAEQMREKVWRTYVRLDQGRQGACVAFGWSHELSSLPVSIKVSNESAYALYRRAQQIDEWPGEEPSYSGTSLLAGAKAVQEAGRLDEYRWASTERDVLLALAHHGPVVIAVPWFTGMFDTDAGGYLNVTGSIEGWHCVCLRGVVKRGGVYVPVGRNSWGERFGTRGDFRLHKGALEELLSHRGAAACVPVRRR